MPSFDSPRPLKRTQRAAPAGITREDSDDELGVDDHPWEWVYAEEETVDVRPEKGGSSLKRKRGKSEVVGARMGSFECAVGDIVFLKAEGTGEAWVAIICDFKDDEDGEKTAYFMWFASEKEIRNKRKKRTDNLWVSAFSGLYLTA